MSNFAFANVHQLVILAHNQKTPTDEEWEPYVEYVRNNKPRRALVVTEGGAPAAHQRHLLTTFTPNGAKVAVLTGSALARGVMTALGWFRPSVYHAFPPHQVEEALHFLDVAKVFTPEVKRRLTELQLAVRKP